MNFNSITLTILSLAICIGLGAALWYYSRRPENAGLSLGVLVKKLIIQQNSTLYLLITTLFISGESMMAASVAGEDGRVSVVARLVSHFAIGALAFIGALSFIKTISNFVSSIKERNAMKIFVRFLMMIIILVMALLAPVANTILLAHAFHQSAQLDLFYLNIMGTEYNYFRSMAEYGFSMPYNSWSALHNVVAASVILNIFGFIIILYESLEALATMQGTGILDEAAVETKKAPDKKPASADDEDEEDAPAENKDKPKKKGMEKLTENLETLVDFFYDGNKEKTKKVIEQLSKILNGRSEQESIPTGFATAGLVSELSKVDRKNPDAVKKMKEKIEKFIGGSKSGNKDSSGKIISPEGGLGYVLGKK